VPLEERPIEELTHAELIERLRRQEVSYLPAFYNHSLCRNLQDRNADLQRVKREVKRERTTFEGDEEVSVVPGRPRKAARKSEEVIDLSD